MVRRAPNREWRRAEDDTDSFPVIPGEPVDPAGPVDPVDPVDKEITHDEEASDGEVAPSPPVDEIPTKRDAPAWVSRFGDAVVARLARISAAVAGGLLLCLSFPPFGWWYLAIVAFAPLAWVLTRDTTKIVGGLGYGFLFGAAFYIPLLPWTGEMVGVLPWLALSLLEAVFPALFGLCAVAARRLTGWPIWFAGIWALFEWAKSTIPFGGFP